jgi:hypothetical protein
LPLQEAAKTFVTHAGNQVTPNMRGMDSKDYVLVVQTSSQRQAYKDCVTDGDGVFYLDDTHQTTGYEAIKLVLLQACMRGCFGVIARRR